MTENLVEEVETETEGQSAYIPNQMWIEKRKEYLNFISELRKGKKSDRLETLKKLRNLHLMFIESVDAWGNWLNNVHVISLFPKEELDKIFLEYTDHVEKYIKLDIKATSIVEAYRQKDPCFKTLDKTPTYTV